jgi:hypothetical protein
MLADLADCENGEANARLIAAAPDLLAERDALRKRVATLEAAIIRARARLGNSSRPQPADVSWAKEILAVALEARAALKGGA